MFEIRPAIVSDLEGIAQFYHQAWHESQAPFQDKEIVAFRDLDFMRARIEAFFPHIIVAKTDHFVGLAVAHRDRLAQLFVAPETRGQGLGGRLLAKAEAKLSAQGTQMATLSCLKGNHGAKRFYIRHGWAVFKAHTKMGETQNGPTAPVEIWEMRKPLGTKPAAPSAPDRI